MELLCPCGPNTKGQLVTTKTSTSVLESRFSFDQDGVRPGTYEATPIEMAAQFAALDRAQIHRRSVEMAAPECRIDRNEAVRIMVRATIMERETYKHRARYQHRGALGYLAIELLKLLMNFSRKYGRIFPDYDTLAALLRKDRETVIEAMKRLILHKFVTKHRRSKLIGTPQGDRRVQDSNAYEVHMPEAGLATLPLIMAQASGSDNPLVSSPQAADSEHRVGPADGKDRFWLAEPWRMADGSIY